MKQTIKFKVRFYLMAALFATMMLMVNQADGSCVWGSFDDSRINYSTGPLTGSDHGVLTDIIESNGGTIAPGTSTLTASYLNSVDVFYTSLLNRSTGTLSASEQTALQDWVAGGGTLIVTADIFPLAAYESFTAHYGITNYVALSGSGVGYTVAPHMLTDNVSQYQYATQSKYQYGPDGLLLGDDGHGNAYMTVFEPSTGFSAGGRILVFGDHNMFTDSYIHSADNEILAANMAKWACVPEPCTMGLLGLGGLLLRRRK